MEKIFPGTAERSAFEMIQIRYICCALYFYYYSISSTSDHQALDPKGRGPLEWIRVGYFSSPRWVVTV